MIRVICGLVCGALSALVLYWLIKLDGIWLFIVLGALLGGLIGFYWQTISSLCAHFRLEDLRITEIEIETIGQKWKLANSGSQRRVAWAIFVQMVTRIAIQPLEDTDGDDGVALESLYGLFQFTRNSIIEMEPTRILPYSGDDFDTVETYALAILNQDLRPFLSKWHPAWDVWRKVNPEAPCTEWDQHTEFRTDLKVLQTKIRERAEGLGKIAGVSEIERFMNAPEFLNSKVQE